MLKNIGAAPQHNKTPVPLQTLRQKTDGWEDSFRGLLFRFRYPLFIGIVTVLAFYGRVFLWPFVSADYVGALHLWLDEIRAGQGFHSIGMQIGNYTAPYHYLLAALTYIPGLSNLEVIKISSSVADFFMAAAAAYLCWQVSSSKLKAALCYAVVLCLPTVFLNSAAWGQCDAMYTTFVLLSIAFFMGQKKGLSLLFYGFALAIKLQAIFVLPAFIILWLCARLRVRHLLAGVAGYILLFIPAMLGAGSFAPLLKAYGMQTKANSLTSNIFVGASLLFGVTDNELDMMIGILLPLFIIAIGILGFYCWHFKNSMTRQTDFILLVLLACLTPFLLPAMRDRYYYLAEVLCVVYAFNWPRRFYLPLVWQLVSLPSYMHYLLNGQNPFGYWLVLFALLPSLVLFWDVYRHTAGGGAGRETISYALTPEEQKPYNRG